MMYSEEKLQSYLRRVNNVIYDKFLLLVSLFQSKTLLKDQVTFMINLPIRFLDTASFVK